MFIETQAIEGKGLKLTGRLGDVMKESVEIAYSFVKYFASEFMDNHFLENHEVLY